MGMKGTLQGVLAMLLSLCLIACTTTQALTPITPATAAAKLEPGDKVAITTKAGKHYRFEIVQVTDKAIVGPRGGVALKDIASLEVTEFSGAKTAGLGVGVYAGYVALIALVVGPALAKGLKDSFGGSDER